MNVNGSIAYVSQASWIQSGTIRDNILYGKPMDKIRYKEAIRVTALDKDIQEFDFGDLTEIGQRGINMSGGQKQRIQLARAVYSDSDICLLDDPFSAVDAHTAASLFSVSQSWIRRKIMFDYLRKFHPIILFFFFFPGLCDVCVIPKDCRSRDSSG